MIRHRARARLSRWPLDASNAAAVWAYCGVWHRFQASIPCQHEPRPDFLLNAGAATTLCALHYMACSISIWITQGMGYVKRVSLPTQGALTPKPTLTLTRLDHTDPYPNPARSYRWQNLTAERSLAAMLMLFAPSSALVA